MDIDHIKIIIPTYNRASGTPWMTMLYTEYRDDMYICVERVQIPDYQKTYPDAHYIPYDGPPGLSPKLRFIEEITTDTWVVRTDDDLKDWVRRDYLAKKTSRKRPFHEWFDLMKAEIKAHPERDSFVAAYGHIPGGFIHAAEKRAKDFSLSDKGQGPSGIGIFNYPLLKAKNCWYPIENITYEDFYLNVQALIAGLSFVKLWRVSNLVMSGDGKSQVYTGGSATKGREDKDIAAIDFINSKFPIPVYYWPTKLAGRRKFIRPRLFLENIEKLKWHMEKPRWMTSRDPIDWTPKVESETPDELA